MPFSNEHSGRLQDPGKFAPESFRRNDSDVFGKKLPAGVEAVWAKFKGRSAENDPVIPQAIRFPKDKYTEEQAKKWLDDNNIKYILFEPAKHETKESKFEVKIKDQTDEVLKESLKTAKSWYVELKKEDESECNESEVIDVSKMILREMIQRGKQKFHPENWKNEIVELYTKTFNEIMKEGIKIPESVIKILPIAESEKQLKYILRYKRGGGEAKGIHEILIESDKDVLDRFIFSGNLLEQDESKVTRKTMNIQTPNGKSFKEWMKWEGSIPAKESELQLVHILKEGKKKNTYMIRNRQAEQIQTNPTLEKFNVGQEAWIDQWENLYNGEKGGAAFGNLNESIPVYISIEDSGTVELIEDTSLMTSFKFNGEKLKDLYTMMRESIESDTWIFSKGKLSEDVKEEICVTTTTDGTMFNDFDLTNVTMPCNIKIGDLAYRIVETKNGKYLMQKEKIKKNP